MLCFKYISLEREENAFFSLLHLRAEGSVVLKLAATPLAPAFGNSLSPPTHPAGLVSLL